MHLSYTFFKDIDSILRAVEDAVTGALHKKAFKRGTHPKPLQDVRTVIFDDQVQINYGKKSKFGDINDNIAIRCDLRGPGFDIKNEWVAVYLTADEFDRVLAMLPDDQRDWIQWKFRPGSDVKIKFKSGKK